MLLALALVAAAAAGAGWVLLTLQKLDQQLVEKFATRRWEIPSRIYSDSVVLYAGQELSAVHLTGRLERLNYRKVSGEIRYGGEYRYDPRAQEIDVFLRDFAYPDRMVTGYPARLHLDGKEIRSIERVDTGTTIDSMEIEPEALAGIYEKIWEERRLVRLQELPTILVRAVLAAEDRRFFEHSGIDVRGVLRALVTNLRSGRVVQGGSTLTQQLIKNFFLTEARTLKRKLTEAGMAVLAERRFTKLQILEMYLNEIYLGQRGAKGIYGVWEGAQFYFGKEPKDLTIAESAMLAGLIKAPARLSPTRNPERARVRRDEVLGALLEAGDITVAEFAQAVQEPLPLRLPTVANTDAPYFVDFVRGELEGQYPEDTLTSEGFRIFTTLDPTLQREAERAVHDGLQDLEKRHLALRRGHAENETVQACLVAIQPQTGEIKAMVGGRSYQESQFNRVTQARRQPGSVFKPLVYLAAYESEEKTDERRFLPTSRLEDTPFLWSYEGGDWSPANYKGEYHGEVSLRQALEQSLNSATARLAQEVGLEKIHDVALRLGFPNDLPAVPSLVLGSVEVTPLEVARAFAAIANVGFRTEVLSIRAVIDGEGKPLVRNTMHAAQAVSPRVAYLVTSLMEGVLDHGTGRGARLAGLTVPAAGKTGTTNEGRDAWFVGFTPDLLTVVWVGFDREIPLGLSGAQAALPLWVDFMKAATADRPATAFLIPPGIETATIDPRTGQRATAACPETLVEHFFEGEAPTETCALHPGSTSVPEHPAMEPTAPLPILVPTPSPVQKPSWLPWP